MKEITFFGGFPYRVEEVAGLEDEVEEGLQLLAGQQLYKETTVMYNWLCCSSGIKAVLRIRIDCIRILKILWIWIWIQVNKITQLISKHLFKVKKKTFNFQVFSRKTIQNTPFQQHTIFSNTVMLWGGFLFLFLYIFFFFQ